MKVLFFPESLTYTRWESVIQGYPPMLHILPSLSSFEQKRSWLAATAARQSAQSAHPLSAQRRKPSQEPQVWATWQGWALEACLSMSQSCQDFWDTPVFTGDCFYFFESLKINNGNHNVQYKYEGGNYWGI